MATSAKATATAVAHAKEGRGLIRINGSPINLVQPEILRLKVYEPILVAGEDSFSLLDIRVRVKGGGHTSQVYAIRQAIAKALIAYYSKYVDAYSALELKKKLVAYDRTLLIADPRRAEPKKFGGHGARARRQKSYANYDEGYEYCADESLVGIKAGAVVCSDPKLAEVILVDSTSTQGRLFIRDWGDDTNKAVLEHSWVKHSIAVGRVLDRDEQWGGCLTVDDGLPIVKEEADFTPPKSVPVPTEPEKSSPNAQTPIDAPPPPETSQPPTPHEPFQDGLPYTFDPNAPHPSQQLLTHLPPHTMAAMVAQAQQMAQSFPASLPQHMIPNVQFPPGVPGVPQAMMLMAMLQQQQGMMNWNGAAPQNLGAPFGNPQMMNPMTFGQYPPDSLSALSSANTSYAPNSSFMSNGSIDPPQSPSGIPPSLRQKSPMHSRSTPSSYSGQMRSASPTNYYAAMSSYSSKQSTPPGPAPSLLSTLFRTKKGCELSFFVQVDLNNRSKVVSAIKRNGGKIVTNNMTADYSILYSRSKTYDHLLQSTLAAGRPAISASFVFDSVEQNEILDSTPYEFGLPGSGSRGRRKRGRSEDDEEGDVESPEGKAERKRLEKNRRQAERQAERRLKTKDDTAATSVKETSKRPKAQHSSLSTSFSAFEDPSRPRSPTPPPEHTRIRRGFGENFLYSEHEFDYCRRYIRVLLERDHRISNTAISQALYKKMDNHSRASWGAFITGKSFGAEFEEMRKRASIAFRKRQASQAKQQAAAGPSGMKHSPTQHWKPDQHVEDTAPKRNILDKEIEIVAQFFATGGGQEESEESEGDHDMDKVWGRLTAQVQCISANSWEEFYSEHHEEVGKRYSELTNIPAADATSI
ncbi:hypothetical protein DXG03_002759 [Asterophora parasitica]|uniref:BRCT domain-containing protein n=1 Tax=Asterophora parasitica TaxID=117018 RepID=A0A9P7KAU2_9AGAR|nr:hypothetical protein DXG03_002759 [Asterophora parasitica]